MILIYHLNLNQFDQRVLYELLDQLSEGDKNKNKRYRRDINKLQHLAGRWLLFKGLEEWCENPGIINEIILDEDERPFLPKAALDFNISHSKNIVVCALSRHRLGIDVEFIDTSVELMDFKQTMNEEQWSYIKRSKDPYVEFYRHWTIKESVIKAHGKGLTIPLMEIEVLGNTARVGNQIWFLDKIFLKDKFLCHTSSKYREKDKLYHLTQF